MGHWRQLRVLSRPDSEITASGDGAGPICRMTFILPG